MIIVVMILACVAFSVGVFGIVFLGDRLNDRVRAERAAEVNRLAGHPL